jgi:hypothetical protein
LERWADVVNGSDEDDDPTHCTREPDPDDETKFIYHACHTLAYARSVSTPYAEAARDQSLISIVL